MKNCILAYIQFIPFIDIAFFSPNFYILRERVKWGQREREDPSQAPCPAQRLHALRWAWSLTWGKISQPRDHDLR